MIGLRDSFEGFRRIAALGLAMAMLPTSTGLAHIGRRFTVEIVDGKLQAQGINTGDPDGAPAVRPYTNVIHNHWKHVDGFELSYSTLPGYDVSPSAATELLGESLTLELTGAMRWQSPPMMPNELTRPIFTPLAPGQVITVEGLGGVINSNDLGSFTLLEEIPFGGVKDIDPFYQINAHPTGEIQVLRFVLSSSRTTILPSDPIYVLLSPDGADAQAKLHHTTLFLENYFATIPEPSALVLVIVSIVPLLRRKRSWIRAEAC